LALACEKLLQHGANFLYIHRSNLPDDLQIHIGIVMRHDITHTAHFSKGKFADSLAGRLSQMGCGLPDDFDAPDHGVLFFCVSAKVGLCRVLDVGSNDRAASIMSRSRPSWSVSIQA